MYGTDCICLSVSTQNVLFLQRGDRGLVIVNKGGDFFQLRHLDVPGMKRRSLK